MKVKFQNRSIHLVLYMYEVYPKSSWTTDITSRLFIIESNCFVVNEINMYGMHTKKIRPASLMGRT